MEYVHKQFTCYISGIWYLYSCSTMGKHAKSMQKISGSNLVCSFFESRYMLVCTSTYQYKLVYSCMCWYELVCTGMYLHVLLVAICTGINKFILLPVSMYQYI